MEGRKMECSDGNNKSIALLRVSSLGQEGNTSRFTQERDVKQYCSAKRLELVKIFYLVETAKDSSLRKHHKAAVAWADKHGITNHVYHRFDREARNLTDNENNETLVRLGKRILHYALDNKVLHKDSPDSEFLNRDINAAINKHYSRELGTKVKSGTKAKAEEGWFPGTHVAFGYVHLKNKNSKGLEKRRGTIIVKDHNPKVVTQVQREFELRATKDHNGNPISLREIRRRIIEEGFIPLSEIKSYHIGTIERRLKNKFYDGRFDWQGKEYRGKHERIISAELFWAVQETFGFRNPYTKKTDGLFSGGWMKCGKPDCGCHVVYNPTKKTIKATGEQKVFKYYHCTNGKGVHPSLKGMRITEENLMNEFDPAIKQISITKEFSDLVVEALNENEKKTKRAIERDIDNYEQALKALEVKEDRAYDNYDSGLVDRDNYQRQIQRVREERSHFTKLMKRAQLDINGAALETAKTILQLATNAESLWNLRTPEERRSLLDDLLYNPTLDGLSVRYEIIKPLRTLSEMKTDQSWRRE
jgi:hypothetical protein